MMEKDRFWTMVEKLHQAVLTRCQAEGGLADFLGRDFSEVNFYAEAEEIAVELLTEKLLDVDGLIEEDRDSPRKATRISFTAHTIEKTIMAITPE